LVCLECAMESGFSYNGFILASIVLMLLAYGCTSVTPETDIVSEGQEIRQAAEEGIEEVVEDIADVREDITEEVTEEIEDLGSSEEEGEEPMVSLQVGCPSNMVELVRTYCGIPTEELVVDDCFVTYPDTVMGLSVWVDELQVAYADYGVSNLADYVRARYENEKNNGLSGFTPEIEAEWQLCELETFPVEDLGDEAIGNKGYQWVSGVSCEPRPIDDGYDMFIVQGNYIIIVIGTNSIPLDRGIEGETCTVEEAKNLVRTEILGEGTALEVCEDEACFEERFMRCEPASIEQTLVEGLSYYYEIIGPEGDGCRVKSRFTANPNPAYVGPEMTCVYDNTAPFADAITDTSRCEGELYDLMTGG